MSNKDEIKGQIYDSEVIPGEPMEAITIDDKDFKEYKKGMGVSNKTLSNRNLIEERNGSHVPNEKELRIVADYAITGSYAKTAERYCVYPGTVRSMVSRNPLEYQHFSKLIRKKLSKSFKNLISLSTQVLEDRLISYPDNFKPLELNAIFGTAYEKLRAELNLPDKIVKVEGEEGMRNLIDNIDKELSIYEHENKNTEDSSSATSTA